MMAEDRGPEQNDAPEVAQRNPGAESQPNSSDTPEGSLIRSVIDEALFEIGEDQLLELKGQLSAGHLDELSKLADRWAAERRDVQVRVGTLLKSESASFLLGAGASKEAGGILIGSIPVEIERPLLEVGIAGGRVRGWLKLFYAALRHLAPEDASIPGDRAAILARADGLTDGTRIKVNLEKYMSLLYRWRVALPESGGKMRITTGANIDVSATELDECIQQIKKVFAQCCQLPNDHVVADPISAYRSYLRKVLTRPLNLKRVNIFTLNYDTLVEQAADALGIVVLDGFVGTVERIFRPESYDHDLYFPGETTEGRVHRFDRLIHLYKLHGSLTWRVQDPSPGNPYGITAQPPSEDPEATLIYPTPAKFGETLGMPYADLFRRFANTVVRPQSTLFVIGYGFGDDHVNAIIRQALAVPSFTLVVVDPYPTNDFVKALRESADSRVWVLGGETFGCFSAFVNNVLPDLRDEDILRKVMATSRALGLGKTETPTGGPEDAE